MGRAGAILRWGGRVPELRPDGGSRTHNTVLFEWTARDASAARYDSGPPRQVLRVEQPFRNHNGGRIAFNTLSEPGDEDYGLLYVGLADGGGGGDPLDHAQDLGSLFGKLLRIDPLGSNSANGRHGIPAGNPFVYSARRGALREIYAYGLRNPQHLAWDRATGRMFLSDIGQSRLRFVRWRILGKRPHQVLVLPGGIDVRHRHMVRHSRGPPVGALAGLEH